MEESKKGVRKLEWFSAGIHNPFCSSVHFGHLYGFQCTLTNYVKKKNDEIDISKQLLQQSYGDSAGDK